MAVHKPKAPKAERTNKATDSAEVVVANIPVTMLPVTALLPNKHNPNRMTDEAYNAFVAEVATLGSLPKPIVVTPIEPEIYQIIDGEYSWNAAKDNHHTKVPCQIMPDLDKFECLRQMLAAQYAWGKRPYAIGPRLRSHGQGTQTFKS